MGRRAQLLRVQVCEAAVALAPHAQCCHMAYKLSGTWAQGQLPQPAPVAEDPGDGRQIADGAASSHSDLQQENVTASCNGAERSVAAAGAARCAPSTSGKAAAAQQAIAEAAPQPVCARCCSYVNTYSVPPALRKRSVNTRAPLRAALCF